MFVRDGTRILAAGHFLSTLLYMTVMCVSYRSYIRDRTSIEVLIQAFSLNFAAERVVCHVLLTNGILLQAKSLMGAFILTATITVVTTTTSFNAYTAIIVFGALSGAGQGCLRAVQTTLTHRLVTDQQTGAAPLQTIKLLSVFFAVAVLRLTFTIIAPDVTRYHDTAFSVANIVTLLACAFMLSRTDLDSINLPSPSEIENLKQCVHTRVVNVYVYVFSAVIAVLSYYDIIFPFIVLYTNHTNSPRSQLHDLSDWIKVDSEETVFYVIAAFVMIREASSMLSELLMTILSRKTCCSLFYVSVLLKLVCVAFLPLNSVVLYSINIAAFMSGAHVFARTIPSFNMYVDSKCLAVGSSILIVVMLAGGHIDNETLSISMTLCMSMFGTVLTLLVAILTLTDMRPDTTFAKSMIVSATGRCLPVTVYPDSSHAQLDV